MGIVLLEMQLVYIIAIFENNYNLIRNCFKTDSVNVMKIFLQRNAKGILIFILTRLSHIGKPWKLSLGTTTLKTFVSYIGLQQTLEKLDELEKCWANNAASNI